MDGLLEIIMIGLWAQKHPRAPIIIDHTIEQLYEFFSRFAGGMLNNVNIWWKASAEFCDVSQIRTAQYHYLSIYC